MKLASDFRASAREALKGKWGIAAVAGIIASILGASSYGGGGALNLDFSGFNNSEFETEITLPPVEEINSFEDVIVAVKGFFSGMDPVFWTIMATALAIGLAVGLVIGIALFIVGSIVAPGYAQFNLNLIDGENAEINDLFKYFKVWKNAVLANLLRSVYTFLWSLLCFIPGIIATYTYAMVPYLLAENPELTAKEACAKSKEIMEGNRMRLFCLTFSFIGWSILCAFTCGIGCIVLTPYIEASIADFYREITDSRKVPEPDEDIPIYIPESN